jgi:hypothetical protein
MIDHRLPSCIAHCTHSHTAVPRWSAFTTSHGPPRNLFALHRLQCRRTHKWLLDATIPLSARVSHHKLLIFRLDLERIFYYTNTSHTVIDHWPGQELLPAFKGRFSPARRLRRRREEEIGGYPQTPARGCRPWTLLENQQGDVGMTTNQIAWGWPWTPLENQQGDASITSD